VDDAVLDRRGGGFQLRLRSGGVGRPLLADDDDLVLDGVVYLVAPFAFDEVPKRDPDPGSRSATIRSFSASV